MTRLGSPQGDRVAAPALSLTSCDYLAVIKNKTVGLSDCVTTPGSFTDLRGPASPPVA